MPKIRNKKIDDRLQAVADALTQYELQHPNAQVEIYRQSIASIRVRIVDANFAGSSKADRHDTVWTFLEGLPDDTLAEISMLLLLTPDEVDTSFANYDFDHPIPSRL